MLLDIPVRIFSFLLRVLVALFCWKPLACTVAVLGFYAGVQYATPTPPQSETSSAGLVAYRSSAARPSSPSHSPQLARARRVVTVSPLVFDISSPRR